MRKMSTLLITIWLLSACAAPEVSSTGSVRDDADSLERRRAFERAVVGHNLQGDGVDVTVLEGGSLVGTHLGVPFVGAWEYRRGVFCTSLSGDDVRDASDRMCYRAAIDGRLVTLVPIDMS
jgi:hypothetical protein